MAVTKQLESFYYFVTQNKTYTEQKISFVVKFLFCFFLFLFLLLFFFPFLEKFFIGSNRFVISTKSTCSTNESVADFSVIVEFS